MRRARFKPWIGPLPFCLSDLVCRSARPTTTSAMEPPPYFAAFNILNGKVIGNCLPRHRSREFLKFLKQLENEVPPDLDIHLILDNYSTHKSKEVQHWLKS